mmetsp:Transcript_13765/g.39333  ORF Transcript_13765/g.39333 Transcript_13765/m.39333 type:complete len:370 (+) Transcript_13765:42-1151(+)
MVTVEDGQGAEAGEADGDWEGRRVVDDVVVDLGMEVESVSVCGLDLRVLRRRGDYYAACAGDLPIRSTGVVLWECGVLLADYLGYARWVRGGASVETPCPAGDGAAEDRGEAEVARDESETKCKEVPVAAKEFSPHPWWMTHPPAPVVPSRFWSSRRGRVLELGGGCGLVTAVLASLGAHVVCSDGDPEALRTAKRNCSEAKSRYGIGARNQWGATDFHELRWGDPAAARRLVKEFGPFDFIVGSDLLYGDSSPPGPLLETLAAVASEPGGRDAEVILAAKSRCVDEAQRFCGLARQRGLWSVSLADHGDFLDGYQEMFKAATGGGPEVPAYNVIHLSPLPAAALLAAEPPAAAALGEAAPPSPKRRKA